MDLHVVYRLYGGENLKGRPPYYSKRASLASALRAATRADADIVVLADGPIPDDMRAMSERWGRVVDITGGPIGMRGSFLAGLTYPDRAGWPDEDLVYFCEDDYLHKPDAILELRRAAQSIDSAHYFALYADTPRNSFADHQQPAEWKARPAQDVGQTHWVNVPSVTSTFGARIGTLREDLGIFRQGMIPYPKRYLDYEIFVVVQGYFPYDPSEIFLGNEKTRFRTGLKALAANTVLAPFRVAYNVRSLSRRRNPHFLYAADPNLASHMEQDFLAQGTDWEAMATDAVTWAGVT
jgi:hypothetical protein